MRITRDKYGMLTYAYDAGPDMAFSFHMLSEVGEPWITGAQKALSKRGWERNSGFVLPFYPHCADFVKTSFLPPEYAYRSADAFPGEAFTYTSDSSHWYVLSRATGKLTCVGRIGGPRGNGRGINYRDRAYERAAEMNQGMRAFYAAKYPGR